MSLYIAGCYKHKNHKTEGSESFVYPQDKGIHWTTLVKLELNQANVYKAKNQSPWPR